MPGKRTLAATLLAVLLCTTGSQALPALADGVVADLPAALTQLDRRPVLPPGWRWESYGGVQVGVPGDWGWDDGGLRLAAWCVGQDRDNRNRGGDRQPAVVRLGGPTPAIHCGATPGGRPDVDPETLVANTGWVVGFDRMREKSDGIEYEGSRMTVRVAGVEVVIQTPQVLRERIAATIHRVRVDDLGCPATHPISRRPGLRPTRPVDVTTLRDVTSVSACKYEIAGLSAVGQSSPWLTSSLRLDGPAADRAVRGIARTPVGGGPDRPQDCVPEAAYGEEVIVLRARSAAGLTEIVLRYAGCDHHGFDDGVLVRWRDPAAVAPFIAGPNAALF